MVTAVKVSTKRRPMTNVLRQDVRFLDTSKNRLLLVGFISVYSLLFITIYDPFDLDEWGKSYYHQFVLIGAAIILFSQFVLRPLIKLHHLKIYSLILWSVLEVVLITVSIFVIYNPLYMPFEENVYEFYNTFKQVGLIIGVPYILFFWYMQLMQKLAYYKKEQQNPARPMIDKANELLTITGENDKVVLAIKYHQLVYVKSAGNYLEIFYLKGEKLTMELVRASLKELQGKLQDASLVRTHRSYIVNVQHITACKKTRKGFALSVQSATEDNIPVSLGYKANFEKALSLKATH